MVDLMAHIPYSGFISCLRISSSEPYRYISHKIRNYLGLDNSVNFWLQYRDDERDVCMISSDLELKEAFYVYYAANIQHITLYIKELDSRDGHPQFDHHVRRNYAKRWKKQYFIANHVFRKKYNIKGHLCVCCSKQVGGLKPGAYTCMNCADTCHKKCFELLRSDCTCSPNFVAEFVGDSALIEDFSRKLNYLPVQTSSAYGSFSKSTTSDIFVTGTGGTVRTPIIKNEYSACSSSRRPASESRILKKSTGSKRSLRKSEFKKKYLLRTECTYKPKYIGFKNFNFLRLIGRGSYSKVFLVRSKANKSLYAMKVLKKSISLDEAMDWIHTERRVFEMARMCPFLVKMFSCFQTMSKIVFVIDFVMGGDLMFHIERSKKLTEEAAKFYACEVIVALNYLHSHCIIYRDLKLDNILLTSLGHIKLTDYGMCKQLTHPMERTSSFCGTPNYISPEMILGEEYSFSVDWWALGILLYELMTGRSPHEVVNMQEHPYNDDENFLFQQILEKPIRFPKTLSQKAVTLLKGLLNKEPTHRLGCPPNSSFDSIKRIGFFKDVNWQQVKSLKLTPPFVPHVSTSGASSTTNSDKLDGMLGNFDTEFTREKVVISEEESEIIGKIDQNEFCDFEYVSDASD